MDNKNKRTTNKQLIEELIKAHKDIKSIKKALATTAVDLKLPNEDLNLLATKAPRVYESLRKAYPYSVGQMHETILKPKKGVKGFIKDLIPQGDKAKDMLLNAVIISGGGVAAAGGLSGLEESKEKVEVKGE